MRVDVVCCWLIFLIRLIFYLSISFLIRDRGSAALYAGFTGNTVDTVYAVFTVYTVFTVFTVFTVYTVYIVYTVYSNNTLLNVIENFGTLMNTIEHY